MNCTVCRQGELRWGTSTVTLERGEMVLVFRKVPALVCEICGEEYVEEDTTSMLLSTAEEAARSGVQLDVREYVAA